MLEMLPWIEFVIELYLTKDEALGALVETICFDNGSE